MDLKGLAADFRSLDVPGAILRSKILYRPKGVLTRPAREKRLPDRDDLREAYGPQLEREMWESFISAGSIKVPKGIIASTVFCYGDRHRAWEVFITLKSFAREAAELLPKGFSEGVFGDDLKGKDSLIVWLAAVHILTEQKRIQRTEMPDNSAAFVRTFPAVGFPSGECFSLINGIGAESVVALRKLEAFVQVHESAVTKPAVRANSRVVFSGREPTTDVKDLCLRLAHRGDRSQNEIAREFTRGDRKKAQSLLAQVRRLTGQGRVSFS